MSVVESKIIVPLQVSKWIKIPLLIDESEMADLIKALGPFSLFDLQRVVSKTEGIYEPAYFVQEYGRYVSHLKEGVLPPLKEFRTLFSTGWSLDHGAIYFVPTEDGRRLLKASQPIVQAQVNEIRYTPEENVFRVQVFGSDTITWGIQIGFPFLFMDPNTCAAEQTHAFPNRALFSAFQRWVRSHTVPTPFLIKGRRINSPIRLGKRCFSWIASHPQLISLNIGVDRSIWN